MPNFYTSITTGAAANSATINAPLSQLDAQLNITNNLAGTAQTTAQTVSSEVASARSPYTTLKARLDEMSGGYAGGNVATLANGASSAGQKVVTVDSTAGFLPTGYVTYTLVGGALEYNQIDTVDSPTQLTLTTNIGTGGIGDNIYVGMVPVDVYQAANSIPHSGSLTLPQAVAYSNRLVKNARSYGASPSASAATNTAAINAALVGGGRVDIDDGTYDIAGVITVPDGTILSGAGKEKTIIRATQAGTMMQTKGYVDHTHSYEITLENITLDGNNAATLGLQFGYPTAIGAWIINWRNSLRNLKITGCSNGMVMHIPTYSSIENVYINGRSTASSLGFYLKDGGLLYVSNLVVSNFATCMLIEDYSTLEMVSSSFYWDAAIAASGAQHLLKLKNSFHNTFRDLVFENIDNVLASTSELLIMGDGTSHIPWLPHYNKFYNCGWISPSSAVARAEIGTAGETRVIGTVFRDCRFLDFVGTTDDILFTNSGATVIDNCLHSASYAYVGTPVATSGVDQGNGAAVTDASTVSESFDGTIHKTTITLTLTGAKALSIPDGADHGDGEKVYTFPQGVINILSASVTAWVIVTQCYEFIPMSVGSTVADPNQGTLTGTEANIIASKLVANYSATWKAGGGSVSLDGSASAAEVYVNVAATDAQTAATAAVTVEGTLTLIWTA